MKPIGCWVAICANTKWWACQATVTACWAYIEYIIRVFSIRTNIIASESRYLKIWITNWALPFFKTPVHKTQIFKIKARRCYFCIRTNRCFKSHAILTSCIETFHSKHEITIEEGWCRELERRLISVDSLKFSKLKKALPKCLNIRFIENDTRKSESIHLQITYSWYNNLVKALVEDPKNNINTEAFSWTVKVHHILKCKHRIAMRKIQNHPSWCSEIYIINQAKWSLLGRT